MLKILFLLLYFISFFWCYSKKEEYRSYGDLNVFEKIMGVFALFGLSILLLFGFDFFVDIFPWSWGGVNEDGEWVSLNTVVATSIAGYFGCWISFKLLETNKRTCKKK